MNIEFFFLIISALKWCLNDIIIQWNAMKNNKFKDSISIFFLIIPAPADDATMIL